MSRAEEDQTLSPKGGSNLTQRIKSRGNMVHENKVYPETSNNLTTCLSRQLSPGRRGCEREKTPSDRAGTSRLKDADPWTRLTRQSSHASGGNRWRIGRAQERAHDEKQKKKPWNRGEFTLFKEIYSAEDD